jgi:7-carboxy-7-deazaguanine synthase
MRVSEWFYSIQGEGVTAGKPSLFIRLSGCNFMCGGFKAKLLKDNKATWYCDTESVWKAGRDMTVDALMEEIFTAYPKLKSWIANDRANIILTGGEPTLPHNIEAIEEIQDWFYSHSIYPYYEVETNGSIVVDYEKFFDQINASPKLANSGMPARLRQNRDAIEAIKEHRNAWFKFVVNIDSDIEEIEKEWVGEMGVPEDRIILMPGVEKLEHLQSTSLYAAEKAIERGWRFSSRLQVSIWNETTGV